MVWNLWQAEGIGGRHAGPGKADRGQWGGTGSGTTASDLPKGVAGQGCWTRVCG